MLLQTIWSLAAQLPAQLWPVVRSSGLVRALLLLPVLPALGLVTGACAKRDEPTRPDPTPALARGDRVVIEQMAAHFFEGRVLAAEAGRLRVQAADSTDSLSVNASDVYRLPPAPRELVKGMLAICAHPTSDGAWLPCRVQGSTGAAWRARTANGEEFELSRARIILPSPLTELNLKRYFARSEAELEFSRSADHAGEPRPEPGWHPSLRERVLAKVGDDWFTAYVRELGDESVVVSLSLARRIASLPLSALAAEPPSSFASDLHRGDFVLVRPETPSEPWARRQVRAASVTELKISDAAGAVKTASPREVVPLRP